MYSYTYLGGEYMDKKELQEVIHEEINVSLSQLANSFKKEKKKTDYVYLFVFSASMLYFLYLIYRTVNSIHL